MVEGAVVGLGDLASGAAINLVELGVVLLVLQAGEQRFGRLVLSAIVLTYLSMRQAMGAFGRAFRSRELVTETN